MRKLSAKDFIEKKKAEWAAEKKHRKTRHLKDISRKGFHHFLREAWTLMPQHNIPEKVFTIERLRRTDIKGRNSHPGARKGDIEYRFGYFIIGKIGNKKGRWTWGQYCPLIPGKDLAALLRKARKEKTIL